MKNKKKITRKEPSVEMFFSSTRPLMVAGRLIIAAGIAFGLAAIALALKGCASVSYQRHL